MTVTGASDPSSWVILSAGADRAAKRLTNEGL